MTAVGKFQSSNLFLTSLSDCELLFLFRGLECCGVAKPALEIFIDFEIFAKTVWNALNIIKLKGVLNIFVSKSAEFPEPVLQLHDSNYLVIWNTCLFLSGITVRETRRQIDILQVLLKYQVTKYPYIIPPSMNLIFSTHATILLH